jgi:uncharacterized membrane protein
MDTTFWVGLVLGAILSLVASIVANIYNERILDKLEHFKLSRHEKRRDKALVEYRRLRHLHRGTRDKQAFTASQITRIMTIYVMVICVFVLVSMLTSDLAGNEISVSTRKVFAVVALYSAGLCTLLGAVVARNFRSTLRKLYNYEAYEAAVLAKWKFSDQEINPH